VPGVGASWLVTRGVTDGGGVCCVDDGAGVGASGVGLAAGGVLGVLGALDERVGSAVDVVPLRPSPTTTTGPPPLLVVVLVVVSVVVVVVVGGSTVAIGAVVLPLDVGASPPPVVVELVLDGPSPVSSANATGVAVPTAAPMPSATASAPIRPM
jgi:hypothetical protein